MEENILTIGTLFESPNFILKRQNKQKVDSLNNQTINSH